ELEAVLAQIMAFAPKTNKINLRKVLVESVDTLAWLSEYQDLALTTRPPDKFRYYSPYFEDTVLLEERLWQFIKLRCTYVLKEAEPLAIEFSPAGEVKGMEIATSKGVIKVTARSVILAAGGFSGNKDYLAEYYPKAARLDCSFRTGGTKGIVLDLVKDIEADIIKAQRIYFVPVLFPAQKLIDKSQYPDLMKGIWLDRHGEDITESALEVLRAGSEKDVTDWFLNRAGQPFYLLFPGNREAALPGLVPVFSLTQLSSQTDIPAEILVKALAGGPPPYYLGTLELQPLYNMGGLAADEQGRILKHGAAIPGLYGAGETVGWLHGETIFPGLPLTEGLVMGRIAGREAACFAGK
ncbi:MAG TPA: FAD-binding protein, partial [Firmicutes bacterium]|nr:FAD-binding protein [Bacillota bacterium]